MKITLDLNHHKERKLNRFSTSELYYLLAGWTTLEEYVNGKQLSIKELLVMFNGTCKHAGLEEILKGMGYECEIKKVLEVDGLEIVAKCDAMCKDYGIEIKTSDKLKEKASRAHEYQAKWYCWAFDKPVWYIMQPCYTSKEFYLKTIGVVQKPNQAWFDKEINKIQLIYKELCNVKSVKVK